MSREATFQVPTEIPNNPRAKYQFKCYLATILEQVGCFGNEGQDVGLGFVWYTGTGLGDGGLNTLSRRMQRALRVSGIISRRANPYFLEQRIKFVHGGDPYAVFSLKEG
jgi:hypothetical protein